MATAVYATREGTDARLVTRRELEREMSISGWARELVVLAERGGGGDEKHAAGADRYETPFRIHAQPTESQDRRERGGEGSERGEEREMEWM